MLATYICMVPHTYLCLCAWCTYDNRRYKTWKMTFWQWPECDPLPRSPLLSPDVRLSISSQFELSVNIVICPWVLDLLENDSTFIRALYIHLPPLLTALSLDVVIKSHFDSHMSVICFVFAVLLRYPKTMLKPRVFSVHLSLKPKFFPPWLMVFLFMCMLNQTKTIFCQTVITHADKDRMAKIIAICDVNKGRCT